MARFRPLRRFGRLDVREMIQAPDGSFLAVFRKSIYRRAAMEEEFRLAFEITDGGRPKGLAITPSGHIFVGEYWRNPRRQALRIWGTADNGLSWEMVRSLPPGSAKHIHNLVWDPFSKGLWVLTGDSDHESALLFTEDEFSTITEVARGSQMVRACHLFCMPEGVYYGTDTERAQNWWVFFDVAKGHMEQIQPLPGSCLYAARMAGRYFISTSVEPSRINRYRRTVLWLSHNLQSWAKVIEFEKDWWPGEYFGFGSITLPRVQGECPWLVFSAIAVKNFDLTTFLIGPDQLEQLMSENSKDVR